VADAEAREQRTVGWVLDAPESRLPLNPSGAEPLPDLSDQEGPMPFAFRFLVPVAGTGGILPEDLSYDEDTQTGVYENLPPGVYMTKNPPKTYGPTQPSGQMDAPDDPGTSDD
jgi:putative ATP-grasp target RiPP